MLALALLGNGPPVAGSDTEVALDAIQARYAAVRDFRAVFVQTSFSAALGKESFRDQGHGYRAVGEETVVKRRQ